ncbi:MAG: AAA family ATPase [Myxococcota bacterium]|nr:AAA family ATPase [Myxococcota bacterium]
MKILEIEIENIRGIKRRICLAPNKKNIVVFGPNGTGKSAVVDAIDFLLSGDISRLTGKGSMGLSLGKHGPHVDANSKDAVVTAKIELDGVTGPLTISRSVDNPGTLNCSSEPNELKEAIDVAKKGNYFLSRAEILKFITSEAGKRSEEIQTLLNLSIIEEYRKVLISIKKESEKSVRSAETTLESSKTSIVDNLGLEFFSEEILLAKVNECRGIHKAKPISVLTEDLLKSDIEYAYQEESRNVNPKALRKTLEDMLHHLPLPPLYQGVTQTLLRSYHYDFPNAFGRLNPTQPAVFCFQRA